MIALLVTVVGLADDEVNLILKYFRAYAAEVSTLNKHMFPESVAPVNQEMAFSDKSTILHWV